MLAGLSAEDRARVLATPKRRTWKMASTLRAIAEAEAERNYQLSLPASEMWTWGPVVKRAEAKARVEMEYELLNMHD